MSKHEGMKVEIYTDIDITGRLEDGRWFPLYEAVMVKGRLGHRCDVVVPVSTGHTIPSIIGGRDFGISSYHPKD